MIGAASLLCRASSIASHVSDSTPLPEMQLLLQVPNKNSPYCAQFVMPAHPITALPNTTCCSHFLSKSAAESAPHWKLGCPMLALSLFHILPLGSTLRGAWMMTGMGR